MLQTFILIIWAISALMGCWSFSLFMRWLSERLARKNTHLQARRSTRSQWLGFILIFVCLGVSVFAGVMAIFLENWRFDAIPTMLIGGSMSLFAAFLVIWATVGDRARGRIRCPKCWYDMSAAVGLQCPECGHEAKDPTAFSKSRRPRWAYVVAAMLLIPGGYGIAVSRDVSEYGPLGLVPTWALMAGWEVLPDEWIGVNMGPSVDGSLRERFEDDQISRSRMRRFGYRLCVPLVDDLGARSDLKRLNLINTLSYKISSVQDKSTGKNAWADPPVDIELLLRLSVLETIDALAAENPTPAQIAIMTTSSRSIDLAKIWLFRRELESGRLNQDDSHSSAGFLAITTEIIGEAPQVIHTQQFKHNLIHLDYRRRWLARTTAELTGVLGEHAENFFNSSYDPDLTTLFTRTRGLVAIYRTLPHAEQVPVLDHLIEWMESDDPAQMSFAIQSASYIGYIEFYHRSTRRRSGSDFYYSDNPETLAAFNQLRESIITHAVNDHRMPNPDEVSEQSPIHFNALQALNEISPGDAGVYRLFRESLLAGRKTPRIDVDHLPDELISQAVETWLEQFGDLQDHESSYVRDWFADNLPYDAEHKLLSP